MRIALPFLALAAVAVTAHAQPPADKAAAGRKLVADAAELGAKMWEKQCHACHDLPGNLGAPPPRSELAKMSIEDVYNALTDGNMKAVGDFMSEGEREAVAMHVTQKPLPFLLDETN